MTVIALTIAGSDSGGGAGIQADLKTFSALGVYGASVLTALTAQNTRGVRAVHDVPPAFIADQIDAVMEDLAVDAVKIGMLSQGPVIETVRDGLDRHRAARVVLDPVMIAASGDPLIDDAAIETLVARLLPRADLITPNLPEAARMLGTSPAASLDEMVAQGLALQALGARAVLMKGGHGDGPYSTDVLIEGGGLHRLSAPRIESRNTHGTGCTLSSAITAGLAKGLPLAEACAAAKDYVTRALEAADGLDIGGGQGPVHHFHEAWTR